jgi:hypothetical protein
MGAKCIHVFLGFEHEGPVRPSWYFIDVARGLTVNIFALYSPILPDAPYDHILGSLYLPTRSHRRPEWEGEDWFEDALTLESPLGAIRRRRR